MNHKKYDHEYMESCRNTWEKPCIEAVPEEKRDVYAKRIMAVDMYIDEFSLRTISEKTGINRVHIAALFEKCISSDEKGFQKGYAALVPGTLAGERKRKPDSESSSGLFSELLINFPELKEFIIGNYKGDPKYTLDKAMDNSALFQKFLGKCRDIGLGDSDYPFNTKERGRISFYQFLNTLRDRDLSASKNRMDKDSGQIQASTGKGERYTRLPVVPYQCVQVDGHIIDIIYTTEIELEDGTTDYLECQRCWLFAVIDVATRCILGYSLSQEFNYNQYDVLRAVKDACSVHAGPKKTAGDELKDTKKVFPSTVYPELEHMLFDSVMLDNAKTHLSENVISKLTDSLGCTMIFGAVATPETRGIVERFFGTIEMQGFHRLPSTTGSNTKDIKRKDPEKEARKYRFTFRDLCILTEELISEYNDSPHTSLHNRTPIQEMGEKLKNGFLPCIPSKDEQKAIEELLFHYKKVKVKGNREKGRRPYISFIGARYRNDLLSSDYSLAGKKITICIDPYDISSVTGYLSDGTCIGKLDAAGESGKKAHSLMSRKRMNRFASENGRKNGVFSSPVTEYEENLKQRAKKSKQARTKLDILRNEIGETVGKDLCKTDVLDMSGKAVGSLTLTHADIEGRTAEEIYLLMKRKRGHSC